MHTYIYIYIALTEAPASPRGTADAGRPAARDVNGYYVKVVIVEVVITAWAKISNQQAKNSYIDISPRELFGYNHPGYDHLYVALSEGELMGSQGKGFEHR